VTAVLFGASALLTAVAVAGVLAPVLRPRRAEVEDGADAAIRAIRDLDEQLRSGDLEREEHAELRADAERRAVAVLRASGGDDLRVPRRPVVGPGGPAATRSSGSRLVPLVAGGILLAVVGAVLATSVRDRSADEGITGGPGAGPATAIEVFEQRVRDHPGDLAARLDLADRYLAAGNAPGAIEQYRAALELDPGNAEALARLGFLLFRSGEAELGLATVDRALAESPGYPEALYFRGVILLGGLDRPAAAVAALRDYLEAAPFGAYREQALALIAEASA